MSIRPSSCRGTQGKRAEKARTSGSIEEAGVAAVAPAAAAAACLVPFLLIVVVGGKCCVVSSWCRKGRGREVRYTPAADRILLLRCVGHCDDDDCGSPSVARAPRSSSSAPTDSIESIASVCGIVCACEFSLFPFHKHTPQQARSPNYSSASHRLRISVADGERGHCDHD